VIVGEQNLDLIINCLNAPALILKNKAPKKNFISLSFKGDSINTFGVGCKAYLFAGAKMQYQQLMAVRGFMSSTPTQLHFGIDSVNNIDSLLIVWPNQKYQLIKSPAINKNLVVNNKDAQLNFVYANFFPVKKEPLQDISAQVNCKWTHKENDFLDYNVQYLIPHRLSTRGPKLAVADVNKDGLDDFYACGARGEPGVLMVQQKNGTFISVDTALFNIYAACEDVDAVFFDANGDTFPDLFVVSGGNQVPANALSLLDRLYLNDGKGHFKIADNPMSVVYENKSCVSVADVDNDGDIDIFIGNLANPVSYGMPTTSYLYINDGKGHFAKDENNFVQLSLLGMVTAASFADIDNDGWKDLIVTGEWMPVKIFKNNKGKFTVMDLPQSTGLWQSLYCTDVNGDGFADILAGNWGWNNKFWAGKNGPLKLYIKDFDNNGSIEQIMAYTINGKEYPFLAKDELERSLPVLKKAYLKYSDVAGQTVQYIFYDLFKDYRELQAEVLASSCFINDGKGNFKRMDLPQELQLAPIFAFTQDPDTISNSYMAAGNFYGVIPYEGRYDALQPGFFSYNKNNRAIQYNGALASLRGEARDAKWINYTGGSKVLVIANNDQPLTFLKSVNH
jgi:enediyne biosynthesis protein E4